MYNFHIKLENLAWQSNWDADGVGYEHLGEIAVGIFTWANPNDGRTYDLFIDTDNWRLLEIMANEEDDE